MGTPGIDFQFKIGDTVAYRCRACRKGTVVEISPLSNKARVLWARKATTVDSRKLTLIAHIKPIGKKIE